MATSFSKTTTGFQRLVSVMPTKRAAIPCHSHTHITLQIPECLMAQHGQRYEKQLSVCTTQLCLPYRVVIKPQLIMLFTLLLFLVP